MEIQENKLLRIKPIDTIIEFRNDISLLLKKEAFLNLDSTPVQDEVLIKFNLFDDNSTITKLIFGNQIPDFQKNIYSIVEIKAFDKQMNNLIVNPKVPINIRFHPKTGINTLSYWVVDSTSSTLVGLFYLTEKFETKIKRNTNSELIPDILIKGDYLNVDSILNERKKQQKKIHDHIPLTTKEIVGYEMTLKNFGYYYLSQQERLEGVDFVNLKVIISNLATLEIPDIYAFLISNNNDYRFYIKMNKDDENNYILEHHNGLPYRLPINQNFKLFFYGFKNDEIYYSQKTFSVQTNNQFEIKLQKVSKSKLIEKIKKL